MLKLIDEYRVAVEVVVAILLLLAAAAVGAVINGWRLDSAHQHALSEKTARITELEAAVKDQNHAVDILAVKGQAAEDRRKAAEAFSTEALRRLGSRNAVVANSRATNCDGVLKEAWGVQ